ncbi:unnamed protein product, partial [Owenia fusiformis]
MTKEHRKINKSFLFSLFNTTHWRFGVHCSYATAGIPSRSSIAQVYVHVTPINEHTPIFSSPTGYSSSISEGAPLGTMLMTLSASDDDSGSHGQVRYSFLSGNANGDFAIVSSNGEIVTTSRLDRETTDSYTFTVRASDSSPGSADERSVDATVNVMITDANDNAPIFSPLVYTTTLLEGAGVGTIVEAVTSTDRDLGTNAVTTYSITAGNSDDKFAMVSNEIVTTGALNQTNIAQYRLEITATDRGIPPLSSVAHVVINVLVQNDYTPVFNEYTRTVSILENIPIGSSIYTAVATDGDHDSLAYSITRGNSLNNSTFIIDFATGEVKVGSYLDYDTNPQRYTLTISVSDVMDSTNTRNTNTMTLTVKLLDVNDNAPAFPQSSYTVNIDESAGIGDKVAVLSATDADATSNADILYSISGGEGIDLFTIGASTGEIFTLDSLDAETKSSYVIHVKASDRGTPALSTIINVVVNVNDVNDNVPTFEHVLYSTSILENQPENTFIATVNADDGDTMVNGQITYSILSSTDPNGHFNINASSGLVTTNAILDRESIDGYDLVILAVDNGSPPQTGSATLSVDVKDTNDNSPIIHNSPTTITIAEDIVIGTVVGAINATDDDIGINGELKFYIVNGDPRKNFNVDINSGQISVFSNLDRETSSVYVLSTKVEDKGSPKSTTTGCTTVSITDINDNRPVFPLPKYEFNLPEDVALLTSVGQVTAGDADFGLNAAIEYSIIDGDINNVFTINVNTGSITTNRLLDFETSSVYKLVIRASDRGILSLSSTIVSYITIENVNERPPVFIPSAVYTVSVSESAKFGDTVIAIQAEDPDQESVIYTILSGDPMGLFTIDFNSGMVSLIGVLDREISPSYTLIIKADDGRGLTNDAILNIAIVDVNDNEPECLESHIVEYIPENVNNWYEVTTATCTDVDMGRNADLRYAITSGNLGNVFSINPSSGVVNVMNNLDYESITEYQLTITITDTMGAITRSTLSSTILLSVYVTRVNDFDPTFTTPAGGYLTNISESLAVGQHVLQVTATDADRGVDGDLKYTIISDREVDDAFTLRIKAEDSAVNATMRRYVEETVKVYVDDENDNIPLFTPSAYSTTVLEGEPIGASITLLTVTDADIGTNGDVNLVISEGNSNAVFLLDGNTLKIQRKLDHELRPRHNLKIMATDAGHPPLSSIATVSVSVLSQNEFVPQFVDNATRTITIPENIAINSVIYEASATDFDKGIHGDLTYSITSGVENNEFIMDYTTGILSVGSVLDYDVPPKAYTLTLSVVDTGDVTYSATMTLVITLSDINDNPPTFSNRMYKLSILEDTPAGTNVTIITAYDIDSAGPNNTIAYRIVGGDTVNKFMVHAEDGTIGSITELDRESQESYLMYIMATDAGTPALSSMAAVSITLIDVNDNSPVFQLETYEATVRENRARGEQVVYVLATDEDAGLNSKVTYNISAQSDPNGHFYVDDNTGRIHTTASLDRESIDRYTLIVLAADSGLPSLTSSATVTVNVADENDNDPIFKDLPYRTSIHENTTRLAQALQINAVDYDTEQNAMLIYRIHSGNINGDFTINSMSGSITIEKELDRERINQYKIVVAAEDTGIPVRSDTATATITVLDNNDNPPAFTSDSYTLYVSENTPLLSIVGTITATDPDINNNGAIQYEISEVISGFNNFIIDSAMGVIKTNHVLNREHTHRYELRCIAKDNGEPVLTGTTTVTIIVEDLNDNAPLFNQAQYDITIVENTQVGNVIFQVQATDMDLSNNANLIYSLAP